MQSDKLSKLTHDSFDPEKLKANQDAIYME